MLALVATRFITRLCMVLLMMFLKLRNIDAIVYGTAASLSVDSWRFGEVIAMLQLLVRLELFERERLTNRRHIASAKKPR